jgi:tetratricopeptide (TPR) repeat protein
VDQLGRYAAIRLFVERTRAVRPAFRLTEENAPAVVRICQRLDGIPLALELAAARLTGVSPEQLAARLDQRFRLLTTGSPVALARHRTLTATVEWSYCLLTEPERRLFDRLAVFAGGWTLEAAEAVCADAPAGHPSQGRMGYPIAAVDVPDLLVRLVDKSLVVAEPGPDGADRYRLLETLRQYARGQLRAGGEAAAVGARHAAFYLEQVERLDWLEQASLLAPPRPWLAREDDNLRAALRWLCEAGDAGRGLRLGAALGTIWLRSGRLSEARQHLGELLAVPGAAAPTAERARVLYALAALARRQTGFDEAQALFEEGLAIVRRIGDRFAEAWMLTQRAVLAYHRRAYRSALADLAQAGAAATSATPAVAPVRLAGRLAWRDFVRAMVWVNMGDHALAQALLEPLLAAQRRAGERGSPYVLWALGEAAAGDGRSAAAGRCLREAVVIARDDGDFAIMAWAIEGLAGVAAGLGQAERGSVRPRGPTGSATPGRGRAAGRSLPRCPAPAARARRARGSSSRSGRRRTRAPPRRRSRRPGRPAAFARPRSRPPRAGRPGARGRRRPPASPRR